MHIKRMKVKYEFCLRSTISSADISSLLSSLLSRKILREKDINNDVTAMCFVIIYVYTFWLLSVWVAQLLVCSTPMWGPIVKVQPQATSCKNGPPPPPASSGGGKGDWVGCWLHHPLVCLLVKKNAGPKWCSIGQKSLTQTCVQK